jgi:parallel beta-helix repeat protein
VDNSTITGSDFVDVLNGSTGNTVSGATDAIRVQDSDGNVIQNNAMGAFKDIVLVNADHNIVRGNHTTTNGIAEPIFIDAGSDFNLIEGNTISGTLDFN